MFPGNPHHAQRCLQMSYLLRYSGQHDICLSLLKKPFYQSTKYLLHFYSPARQPSRIEASSCTKKCDQEHLDTVLQAQNQVPLLDPSAYQGADQPERSSPLHSDTFQPKISKTGTGTLTSETGDSELPRGTAKKARISLYEKSLTHKEGKKLVLRLARERVKGPWVHDWRIPFGLLKENHQDQDVARAAEVGYLPWKNRSGFQRRIRQRRADEIERPEEWNAVTFRNYVDDLTTSSVDRLMQRQLYGGKTTHVQAVAKVLGRLFEDVGRKEIITPGACSAAIEFFNKHSMISKARVVFNQLENLLIDIEPETVDVMLRGTAAQKDLHNYTYVLRTMLRRGFKPNGWTWVALLMAVDSSEVRKVIIDEMRTRKLLKEKPIMKKAVVLTIRDEWSNFQNSGLDDVASFLTTMDSRYGKNQWLSVSACNNLLHELGRTKDMKEVMDLVDILIDRGLTPDEVTLTTLITLCSLQYQHDTIINLLRRFHHLPLSKIAYGCMFKLAWNGRMYNCAKVIWRSACINAVASFQMQSVVQHSLLESISSSSKTEPPQTRGEIWKASAGAVIAGIRPSNNNNNKLKQIFTPPQSALPREEESSDSTQSESKSESESESELKTKQRKLATSLIQDDLATAQRFHLVRSLPDLLSEALARDREWQHESKKSKDIAWKRENAVVVDVEPTTTTLRTPNQTRSTTTTGVVVRYCTVDSKKTSGGG